jgi:hypothetical protein
LLSTLPDIHKSGEESNTPLSDHKDKRLLDILQTNDVKSSQAIRLSTGWEKGVDGLWRYEIPDIKSINKDVFNSLHGGETYNTVKLPELIGEDNDLFKSYPQLKNIDVARNDINSGGVFSPRGSCWRKFSET